MAINDVLKDMYKKNTGKELTEEAHNVEDTLKAINRDIPLGGGGGSDSNVYIFDIQYSEPDGGYVASKTFGELYQAYKDGKIVVGMDGRVISYEFSAVWKLYLIWYNWQHDAQGIRNR